MSLTVFARQPVKFSGDHWYAFHNPRERTGYRVFWCHLADDGFIEAADGRDKPWAFRLSPAAFDYGCFGIVSATPEAIR